MERILIHKKHISDEQIEQKLQELSDEFLEVNCHQDILLLNKEFPKELIIYLWKTGIPYRNINEIILF